MTLSHGTISPLTVLDTPHEPACPPLSRPSWRRSSDVRGRRGVALRRPLRHRVLHRGRCMKLLLVNGNTTQAVTDLVRAEALLHARPGTDITAVTATFGVPIVSTELENAIAGHAVLDLLATHAPGHDAAVLAISFDTALIAARQLLDISVIGMTEASLPVSYKH